MTVSGQDLVDAFGTSSVIFSSTPGGAQESHINGTVLHPDRYNPGSITVQYSIDSGAALGDHFYAIANSFGKSDPKYFTVTSPSSNPPPGTGIPPPLCAVTSNPQSGYTSIVSTGASGGSGTIAVSFSGAAYAAISPTVTYGPYSTPSSIAANIAALITKKYLQYGLSAKAFGPNIVYSGNTTIGAVSNITSGPSITTSTSSTSATATEAACDLAPPLPPSLSCTSVTRGQTATCTWTGGAVTGWSFTDGTNTVTRTSTPTSPTWAGVMATSGTVSLTIASGATMTKPITVSPRNDHTEPSSPVEVANGAFQVLPVPPAPTGVVSGLGISQWNESTTGGQAVIINSGPNSDYAYWQSVPTVTTTYMYEINPDLENSASIFYGKQTGTNGVISGIDLLTQTRRHEYNSSTQSHYAFWTTSLNGNNLGDKIESYIGNPGITSSSFLNATQTMIQSLEGNINMDAAVEPFAVNLSETGQFLGNICYSPYVVGSTNCP